MQEITLKLTIDEANLVLEGLGRMPFATVYALVGKIQEQASQQLGGGALPEGTPPDPNPPSISETHDE